MLVPLAVVICIIKPRYFCLLTLLPAMVWTWLLLIWISSVSLNVGSCFQFLLATPFPDHHTYTLCEVKNDQRPDSKSRGTYEDWHAGRVSSLLPRPCPLPPTTVFLKAYEKNTPFPSGLTWRFKGRVKMFSVLNFIYYYLTWYLPVSQVQRCFPKHKCHCNSKKVLETSRAHTHSQVRPVSTREQFQAGKHFCHRGTGGKAVFLSCCWHCGIAEWLLLLVAD